ncbi:MAG: tetratricopeptide repeat protein [Thermonemataceae bacterium]|nr:tetratricopeptide repeat protein [Thermonemataceae bacterium]
MAVRLIVLVKMCLIFANYVAFSQKSFKNPQQLSQAYLDILQKQDTSLLKNISPKAQNFIAFSESFKSKTSTELESIAQEQHKSLASQTYEIIKNFRNLEINPNLLKIKNLEERKLSLVSDNYYALRLIFEYENIKDTLVLEALKDNKKWYAVDIGNEDDELKNIYIQKARFSVAQYQEMAKKAMESKDYEKSLTYLSNAIFLDAKNAQTFYLKGQVFELQGDKFNAKENYRYAIGYNYEFPEAHFKYALLSLDDIEAVYMVIEDLDYCISKNYEANTAASLLLQVYQNQVADYKKRTDFNATDLFYYEDRISYLCDKVADKNISVSDTLRERLHLEKGKVLLKREKQLSVAYEEFKEVLELNPKNHEALYEMAWLENERGNYKEALLHSQKAYQIQAKPEYLSEMAFAKKELKDYKGALTDYNTLFAKGEQYQTAKKYLNRGDCHKMLKNKKMACADYQTAIDKGADDTKIRDWMTKNCK